MMDNPYEVLGISEDATQEEVKAAFRSRARRGHADAGGNEDMGRLQSAYLILADPATRAEYNRTKQATSRAEAMTRVREKATEMTEACLAKLLYGVGLSRINLVKRVTNMLTRIRDGSWDRMVKGKQEIAQVQQAMDRLAGDPTGIKAPLLVLHTKLRNELRKVEEEYHAAVEALEMVQVVVDPVKEGNNLTPDNQFALVKS